MEIPGQYQVDSNTDVAGAGGLAERVDLYRVDACCKLDSEQRSKMGQFFTPPPVARFMASLFGDAAGEVRLLDAGAGVGTLTAAFVEEGCRRDVRPRSVSVVAYELEPLLAEYLHRQFNGHTQVNATDLRMLRYPSLEVLEALGASVGDEFPPQREIDELLEREIRRMADIQSPNPVAAKQKIDECAD